MILGTLCVGGSKALPGALGGGVRVVRAGGLHGRGDHEEEPAMVMQGFNEDAPQRTVRPTVADQARPMGDIIGREKLHLTRLTFDVGTRAKVGGTRIGRQRGQNDRR